MYVHIIRAIAVPLGSSPRPRISKINDKQKKTNPREQQQIFIYQEYFHQEYFQKYFAQSKLHPIHKRHVRDAKNKNSNKTITK